MPRFVVLTRLTKEGRRLWARDRSRVADLAAEVEALDGKVVEQYALLGDHDFCTIVDAPDNAVAQLLDVAERHSETVDRLVIPAIDLGLFVRLLGQTTQTTGPYPWQIGLPARVARRLLRWYSYTRHVKPNCKPLTVEGVEHFDEVRGPAVFIGNHTSHMDALVLFTVLPERYKRRVAWPGAADRWFLKGRKGITRQGWWNSLAMNTFPMKRGGGRAALDYTKWLIDKGWSIAIFPEGTRSRSGKLGRFRAGPAILAVEKGLPVVPIFMQGLYEMRPSGAREITPGPVRVRVGRPLRFPPDTPVGEATRALHKAMTALRDEVMAAGAAAVPAGR